MEKNEQEYVCGYLEDPLGDKSSKQLAGFILLAATLIVGFFTVGYGCIREIPSASLVQNIFFGLLGASLISFGLTLPEHFSKTLNVTNHE